jgi:RNA polymerase sigma-70 factor (ECF subfamily)
MAALGISVDGDWAHRSAPDAGTGSRGSQGPAHTLRRTRNRLSRVACSVAASLMPTVTATASATPSSIAPMERVRAADDDRSDESLLQSHLDGDPRALESLIRRHSGELHGFLTRFLGSAAAADDVFQETFLQVHLSAEGFDSERRFKPWLYTIAANKARDFHRRRKRRAMVSLSAPVAGSGGMDTPLESMIEAETASPSAPAEALDEASAVQVVVDGLPEHHREIISLGYFQKMSYHQMAEVLQIPLGTVKSRLHAAVALFSERWRRARRQGKDNRE